MTFSKQAWDNASEVYHSIITHPFNQELAKGTLPKSTFAYYVEQDGIYLKEFARCHAIVASKISLEHMRTFLAFSDYTLIAEQEVVHEFFNKLFSFKATGKITPATLSYTSYMLRNCSLESVEIAVATLLPCFWVYREVGLTIAKHFDKTNPYARWIETYASEEFGASVNQCIQIFDSLAENTTEAIRQQMLDAFYKSTCLEWHFWNDAYHGKVFDDIIASPTRRKDHAPA